jgi:CRP-like cAMP-binding protein
VALMRHDEKIDHLQKIPLFADLSKKELRFLAQMTSETSVREGSTLVKQGETGQEAMIVEDGTADVLRDGVKIDDLGPGDFFGEMSLINHMPRNADVVATSDMDLLVMDAREFSSVLSEYPEVAVKILKTVVERLVANQSPDV